MKFSLSIVVALTMFYNVAFCQEAAVAAAVTATANVADSIHCSGEPHFKNVRQLTFGGDNAEAYFSFDGKYLIFQKTNVKEGINCDQIWMGKIPESEGEAFEPKLVSTDKPA